MKFKVFIVSLFFFSSLFTGISLAQDKVVVIPLIETPTGPAAPVPKTGQTKCFNVAGMEISCDGTGQDGDIRAGVVWPNPRFVNHGNGTVTDRLTDLIWLNVGNCTSFFSGDGTGQNQRIWQFALDACNALASGYCGLTDNSQAGDWRLPNRRELESLIDLEQYNPALPAGCPLAPSTVSSDYWSATSVALGSADAWQVQFLIGTISYGTKSFHVRYVRCVR